MTIFLKLPWEWVLLVVLLSQLLIIYWPSNNPVNPDAESAIKRAKTDSCRNELRLFSSAISKRNIRSHLKRSCGLDSTQRRIEKVGCALNSSESFIKLEDPVNNSSYCLEVCFTYGHSYGGYNVDSKSCYCGDDASLKANGHDVECHGQNWMDWYRIDHGIYKPNQTIPPPIEDSSDTSQVKIAFLLTVSGRNVMQVVRLLRSIYSNAHIYYIHVDSRDDYLFDSLRTLIVHHKNIILTESRFETIWGGSSLLRMLVDAISKLSIYDWNYLINLSESDFPIKPLRELETYLDGASWVYLKRHNIKGYNFIKKQGLDRNFYQCEDHVWRLGKRSLPTGIVYSGGSDWFALPRDFCLYIAENRDETGSLVSSLLEIYNNTLLPAESFFHTLALNSKFCDRFTDKNLRVTNWRRQKGCKCQHRDVVDWCGCSPHVYRISDMEKLKQTRLHRDLFFARKFDPTVSSSIINAVESQLVHTESRSDLPIDVNDTRNWLNVYDHSERLSSRDIFGVMQQFGLFALSLTGRSAHPELQSIHLYFNQDRFVGLIFQYCDQSDCYQLLVEEKPGSHLHYHNSNCSASIGATLNAIQVSHGFDTGERMFRDYRPLSDDSDIVVYHEWFLSGLSDKQLKSTNGIRFSWINPSGNLEVAQKIKFRKMGKPSRISLAHRLAVTKPLAAGPWTLLISNQNQNCFEYRFLVVDKLSFKNRKISQKQFNRFYRVSELCSIKDRNNTNSDDNSCAHQSWSPLGHTSTPLVSSL